VSDPQGTASRDDEVIFFSYSHPDERWLQLLTRSLRPYLAPTGLKIWSDAEIRPGEQWTESIMAALASARVAILLVSTSYLSSEFVQKTELPAILEAARDNRLTVLWIALDHCAFDQFPIRHYQCLNDPARPLIDLDAAALNQKLDEISRAIRYVISGRDSGPVPVPGPSPVVTLLHDPLLLVGYLYVEEDGKESILLRGDGRLPIIKAFEGTEPSVANVNALVAQALRALFDEVGIAMAEILAAGFPAPIICPMVKVDNAAAMVEAHPWILFKLRLNRPVYGASTTWHQQGYSWRPKEAAARAWDGPFHYGRPDPLEAPLPPSVGDPYKLITQDRVTLELGLRVLECVDMLIFRTVPERMGRRIQFLVVQRHDTNNPEYWEYPKGGMEYHETPLEGALRETEEEAGFDKGELTYCGDLGWQMVDVSYRRRFYDTLRVHGLTFHYTGVRDKIDMAKINEVWNHQWLPFDQAVERVKSLPYAAEFFNRWKDGQRTILARARTSGRLT
jgi:8-oxo-dGTP pyrophosphatase MutT (NUDIX family)